MSTLSIRLFGKLSLHCDAAVVTGLDGRKVQELLCYLLLHRDRPHGREKLATLLWSEGSSTQSRAYLRKALWQLQSSLDTITGKSQIVLVDEECVELGVSSHICLDVAVFERAFALVKGVRGRALDPLHVESLQAAVALYRGDLLEGWYQDWCLFERVRLQDMYLSMLDKLMGYCEAHHQYEAGIDYGMRSLSYDPARERTHQRLMRLHYLRGDRTSALRQYERCVTHLSQELAVPPDEQTVALYRQIGAGEVMHADEELLPKTAPPRDSVFPLPELLEHLKQFQTILAGLQKQVYQDIQTVEQTLNPRR